MSTSPAIDVRNVTHRYGQRTALDAVSFAVAEGEIFGLLGPNGSGKTTLFRLLSTLLPVQSGEIEILGKSPAAAPDDVRREIGITFQSPSLDDRLTVYENLKHQSHLYGLSGTDMRSRIDELLKRVGMSDRASEIVSRLSGGMKRRVEVAKGLLHRPKVLLLDEPSTGLDPGARHDLWRYLRSLRDEHGVTILVTTHLMEEAELCDRLAILNRGQVVGLDTPANLRSDVGGDCITIQSASPDELAQRIESKFFIRPQKVGESLRIERERGHELLRELMESFPDDIKTVTLGKPTLEDVFILRTGHRFWEEDE